MVPGFGRTVPWAGRWSSSRTTKVRVAARVGAATAHGRIAQPAVCLATLRQI